MNASPSEARVLIIPLIDGASSGRLKLCCAAQLHTELRKTSLATVQERGKRHSLQCIRHVARILLRGGGGTLSQSRSDQSHDHIFMPIHKLLQCPA